MSEINDNVSHPAHYTRYQTEVIDITRHLPFCLGNAVKYVLRAPYKNGVEDCDKALVYLGWTEMIPLQITACNAAKFYDALHTYKGELLGDFEGDCEVLKAQYDFLDVLEYILAHSGNYDLLTGSVKWLRRLLE